MLALKLLPCSLRLSLWIMLPFLSTSALQAHLVAEEDPRQFLPDQKHSHVRGEGSNSAQCFGRL